MLVGCATYSTTVKQGVSFSEKRKIFIQTSYDPLDLMLKVAERLKKLGFSVVDKTNEADIIVHYDYDYYHDVIHYTFNLFNISFTDKNTGEILLASGFSGDTPFGVDGLLDRVFEDISKKIR